MAKSKFPAAQPAEATNGSRRLQDTLTNLATGTPTKATKVEKSNQIVIPAPRIQVARIKVIGVTPLICSAFPDKLIQEMEEKRSVEQSAGKKRVTNRPARDFDQEFRDSLYPLDDGSGYGFPAIAFKHAMVDACRQVNNISMVLANRLVFVMADARSKEAGCVRIIGEPRRRRDLVRLASADRPPDVRYRGEFPEWSCWLNIQHNIEMLSVESMVNLLMIAGMSVGIGENRPSSPNKSGDHGMFKIAQAGE